MATPDLLSTDEDSDEDDSEETMTDSDPDEEVDEVVDGVEEELDGDDDEESDEEETTDGDDVDADGDGEEDEEEEVAEAELPGDDADGGEEDEGSDGVLSAIPTKAVIIISAIAVGVVLLLSFLRGGRSHSTQPATTEDLEGDAAGNENYNIDEDAEPLDQDQQMMDNLGMGSGA